MYIALSVIVLRIQVMNSRRVMTCYLEFSELNVYFSLWIVDLVEVS